MALESLDGSPLTCLKARVSGDNRDKGSDEKVKGEKEKEGMKGDETKSTILHLALLWP